MSRIAPTTSHFVTDAAGVVVNDLRCITCGYNLRTCPRDASCPECGEPVEQSLRADLIRFAPRGHVTALTVGIVCGLVLAALQVMLVLASIIVNAAGWGGMWTLYVHALAAIPGQLLTLLAVFCLTVTPPGGRVTLWAGLARWVVLPAAMGAMAVGIGKCLLYMSPAADEVRIGLAVVEFLIDLVWIGGVAALVVHVARLADRIPDRRIGRHALWGGGVFVLSAVLLTFSQIAFMVYFEFLFRWQTTAASPDQDPVFIAIQIMNYAVVTAWLLSIIWCAALACLFLMRIRRAGAAA